MKSLKHPLIITLTFLLGQASYVAAQVKIDTSAIPLFWQLVDTLITDNEPSNALWQKFETHPAYAQIEQSGNRVSYLKKVLPIVFMPSHTDRLGKLIDGEDSPYQYFALHLLDIKSNRKLLEDYLRSNDFTDYAISYQKSLNYLPSDIAESEIKLTAYLALFEDNGFGGKVITMDLLHLFRGSKVENADFFAHEFHHALSSKSKKNARYAPDTSKYYPIIQALNKLPLEGVASLIDKKKYFQLDYYNDTLLMDRKQQETVDEFRNLVHLAPLNLARIDSLLLTEFSIEEKGKNIFKELPWSGHAIGYYMANSIENELGRKSLIEAQYSCLEFIFQYQAAASLNKELYKFSEDTIAFLKTIN